MIATALVDGHALVQLVWVGLAAGLVFVGAFALAILGAVRSTQERRDGRTLAAGAFSLMGVVAGLACIGAVVLGILTMTHKT